MAQECLSYALFLWVPGKGTLSSHRTQAPAHLVATSFSQTSSLGHVLKRTRMIPDNDEIWMGVSARSDPQRIKTTDCPETLGGRISSVLAAEPGHTNEGLCGSGNQPIPRD